MFKPRRFILNGLPERYRYLVVSLGTDSEKKIDFDELTTRLLEEEWKVDPAAGKIVLSARKIDGECHYITKNGICLLMSIGAWI